MLEPTPRAVPRLLVAGEDPAMHTLITAMFHRHGFAVETTGEGPLALDRLRRDHYDAVILDLRRGDGECSAMVREMLRRDSELFARTIVLPRPVLVDELVDEVFARVFGIAEPPGLSPDEPRVQ